MLHQNLEQRKNELREIDEERRELRTVTKTQQDALKCIETQERERRKQMESNINLIHKLLTMVADFEVRVKEDISRKCLRYAIIVSRSFSNLMSHEFMIKLFLLMPLCFNPFYMVLHH